jgi:flagellar basal-body rod protein FlgC
MINAIQIALSGLLAASKKTEAVASNIANQQTVGSLNDPDNAPYTPLTVQQGSLKGADGQGFGVKADFAPKNPAFVPAYDPDSPFANEEGVIGVPNVDLAEESVNLNIAKASYKASAAVIRTASEMEDALLNMFDKKV